ncbi:MAG: TatD DNase family protein [Solirubrobacteraceae bacterium]|nr:TatD DNase family protein [Solirubrobacteraceae bacterium]
MSKRTRDVSPPPLPAPLPGPAFDAHCHLDAMARRLGRTPDARFVDEAMAQARSVGVTRVITVGDSVTASRWCVEAAHHHPDVYAAVAVHPTEVNDLDDAGYAALAELAADDRVVAVGATGLDYYWDTVEPELQREHFRRHIDLAHRAGKPLMIHDRNAHEDVLRIVAEEGAPSAGVIFHAFSGDPAMAVHCAEAGYTLSFPGVVTFANAPGLRQALAAVALSSILVETDAPFLTPHPYRGRPNAPYLIPVTVAAVSEVISTPVSAVLPALWATGERLFGW